jgi:microsomal dipeptidase-like Zn-dependent dipeptidase
MAQIRSRYSDALMFFAPQGQPPLCSNDLELDLAHITCAPPLQSHRTLEPILEAAKRTANCIAGQRRMRLVRSETDLGVEEGQTAVVLGLQAPPEDLNLSAADELRKLHDAGVRIVTIAYNDLNRYGGGFMVTDVGLTEDGRQFIERCTEAGLIIDLAHAGHATARAAVAFAETMGGSCQMMVSHTGAHAVHDDPRNLPDDVLAAVAARGGIIGLFTLTFCLTNEGGGDESDISAFQHHLQHLVSLCGDDSICIGSDGYYCNRDEGAWRAEHTRLERQLAASGATFANVRWPDQPIAWTRPDRMRLVEACAAKILGGDTATKIVGTNLFSWFRQALIG